MKRKQILKKLASVTLAATIAISSLTMGASAATVSDFTDVKPTDWYYASVEYAADNGLFSGTSTTTFSPNASMTRGMFVTVLGRLCGIDESEYLRYRFTDVKPADYYAPYVEWAATYGIVTGATKTTFAPNKKITREQMAAILYRFAAATGNDTDFKTGMLLPFSDKYKVESYALNSMGWAVDKGIINGMGGKLNASGTATRAQVAKVFYEARNVLTSTDIVIDPVEDEPETPDSGTDNGSTGSTGNGLAQYREEIIKTDEGEYTTSLCTVLTNGKPATSKNVTELILTLKDKYPEGSIETNCGGFATKVCRDVFGDGLPDTSISKFSSATKLSDCRPGDIVHYKAFDATDSHYVVVIRKVYRRRDNGDIEFAGLQVVEGNYNGTCHWNYVLTEKVKDFEFLDAVTYYVTD